MPDEGVDARTQIDMGPDDDDATLIDLEISQGALSPDFAPLQTSYSAEEPLFVETITLTPTAKSPTATITVNGQLVLSGLASPAIVLSPGINPMTLEVTTQSGKKKRYDLIATRASSIEYLKASNTDANDNFGRSLALSGDTLAVGAPFESSSATGVDGDQTDNRAVSSGAVYVFIRSGATWAQQAYIKASNTRMASDLFGSSVTLSGDTLAVGAPFESSSATGVDGDQNDHRAATSGAVYVFTRRGSTWTQQAYLKASNTGGYNMNNPNPFGDRFGTAVSLSGDTLAVGAPFEDSNATGVNGNQADNSAHESGAVYVFTRSGATWSQQAYLKASNPGGFDAANYYAGDHFGLSLALSGDTLAVGAPFESSSATGIGGDQADNRAYGSGAVYIFTRSGATWKQQAYVKASNTHVGSFFGNTVSLSGDTLAVGAPFESSSATGVNGNQADRNALDSGAVYIFARSGAGWTQQAYLKASNTEAFDVFGVSVSLFGDTVAVGAAAESSNATGVGGDQANNLAAESGAVYVFVRSGVTWRQQAYIKASNTGGASAQASFGDDFGDAVSLSRDALAVGAHSEDSNTTGVNGDQANNSAIQSGAVYIY